MRHCVHIRRAKAFVEDNTMAILMTSTGTQYHYVLLVCSGWLVIYSFHWRFCEGVYKQASEIPYLNLGSTCNLIWTVKASHNPCECGLNGRNLSSFADSFTTTVVSLLDFDEFLVVISLSQVIITNWFSYIVIEHRCWWHLCREARYLTKRGLWLLSPFDEFETLKRVLPFLN